MEIKFKQEVYDDFEYFNHSGNKKLQQKITLLLDAIKEKPYEGIGKPEALKHGLSGYWSRRINSEHRLIYQVNEDTREITVISIRGHYE
ncbi:addiction module toxin, Txe/YoeB family [Candidatus Symbiothrix dinenymphae]|nr:addiction module toxin, Txe/YoeB family [Candidatus Symbiothrix dinenymphae]